MTNLVLRYENGRWEITSMDGHTVYCGAPDLATCLAWLDAHAGDVSIAARAYL